MHTRLILLIHIFSHHCRSMASVFGLQKGSDIEKQIWFMNHIMCSDKNKSRKLSAKSKWITFHLSHCCKILMPAKLSAQTNLCWITAEIWTRGSRQYFKHWSDHVNGSVYTTFGTWVWISIRLLHSLSLVAIGLSVGYETWPLIGWHHPFVIGWKDRFGLPSASLHYRLMWPVGIPTIFQTSVTVPLHCPKGRQLPAIRAVQWDCERVWISMVFAMG